MMKLQNLSARKINFICIFSFLIWWSQGYMVNIEESATQSGHMFLRHPISEITSIYIYIYKFIYLSLSRLLFMFVCLISTEIYFIQNLCVGSELLFCA